MPLFHSGRLGVITCEDLLWYYPTVDLVTSNSSVDTIIFPTEWWDAYPHTLPHVVQASWAKALQVQHTYEYDLNFYYYKL